MTRLSTSFAACALLVAVSGCTHAGPAHSAAPSRPSSAASSAGSAVSSGQPLTALPATPAGQQMRWVLQSAAASSGPSVAQVDQHVSATFLAAVPAEKLIAVLATTRAAGPIQLQTFIATTPSSGQASVTHTDGQRLLITLSTDTAGLINDLNVKRAPPLSGATSPAALQRAAESLGVQASVLVAGVGPGGTCVAQQSLGDQGPHPLGSMFKLYVLGAVERAVQAGTLSWTTSLTVTDAVKSLPSGQLQDAPAGTTLTVQQAATLMISISDNTAADLLIGAVGAPAVTDAVRAMGNTHPTLLDPFLTTKQMFTLQYDAPALRQQWVAADPDQVAASTGALNEPSPAAVTARTALLAGLPTATPTVTTTNPRPGWLDGLEWYASPLDICNAQAALHQLAQTPAGQPLSAILAKNPGVATGTGWSYVGYKGGEDTGVLAGSWYLHPHTGPATVFILQLSTPDPATIPDDAWFADATGGTIQHLPR